MSEPIKFDPSRKKKKTSGLTRIEWRERKPWNKDECEHGGTIMLDNQTFLVSCKKCGAVLSAWWVLSAWADRQQSSLRRDESYLERLNEAMEKFLAAANALEAKVTDHRIFIACKILIEEKGFIHAARDWKKIRNCTL